MHATPSDRKPNNISKTGVGKGLHPSGDYELQLIATWESTASEVNKESHNLGESLFVKVLLFLLKSFSWDSDRVHDIVYSTQCDISAVWTLQKYDWAAIRAGLHC